MSRVAKKKAVCKLNDDQMNSINLALEQIQSGDFYIDEEADKLTDHG